MVLDGLKFYCNLSVFEQFQYEVVLFPKDTIWILLNLLWILLTETVRNTIKDFQKYRTRQGSSAKKKKRFKKNPCAGNNTDKRVFWRWYSPCFHVLGVELTRKATIGEKRGGGEAVTKKPQMLHKHDLPQVQCLNIYLSNNPQAKFI